MQLSFDNRQTILETLASESLDVLIIGGGITGAGLALQAGAQGLKAGLIEMQDFAAGTSSRSTKLVHGGLRYLKQFEVELVADITKERAIIAKNASHIVKPEWMLLPVYDEADATFTDFSAEVALDLYDRLAEVSPEWTHSFISREEVLEELPFLNAENLLKGGFYLDYVNDDARLTLEIVKKAAEMGVLVSNYVEAKAFLKHADGRISGVLVKDKLTGALLEINAEVVVNATGPWADETKRLAKDSVEERMFPTKGVHLVVDGSKLPIKHTVYMDTGLGDERMFFIIPRGGKTYFGTTDTPYQGNLRDPGITKEDVDYLLAAVNRRFAHTEITLSDVESGWAGLRPLLLEENAKDTSSISRTHEVSVSEAGLVTIAGGKLTDYRLMAMDTFKVVLKQLNRSDHLVDTKDIVLSGGEIENVPRETFQTLFDWYGSNGATLLKYKREAEKLDLPLEVALALIYAVKHEAALTPVDFFLRRTDILLFKTEKVNEWKDAVIEYMATTFRWDEAMKEKHKENLEKVSAQIQLQHLR